MNQFYLNEIQKIIFLNNEIFNKDNTLMNQQNNILSNQLFQNSNFNPFNFRANNFLQRKRNPDESITNFLENSKKPTFFKVKRNENEFNSELENSEIINDTNSNSKNSIINDSTLAEMEIKFKKNNNINKKNYSNFDNNISDFLNNKQNYIMNKATINKKKFEIINFKPDSSNAYTNTKNKYFKIKHYKSKEKFTKKNNIVKKNESSLLNENEANNEIKVIKNNKEVYLNSCYKNSFSTKNINQLTKKTIFSKSQRRSKFRGVSKNGNHWQVLLMHKKGKSYFGSYSSEELAAKIYDILAIKLKGIKARTNFKYSYQQIKKIGNKDFDIKSKNINDIISELLKE